MKKLGISGLSVLREVIIYSFAKDQGDHNSWFQILTMTRIFKKEEFIGYALGN